MNTVASKNIREIIYDFMTQRVVYHTIIWLLFLVFLILFEENEHGFFFTLTNELINVSVYALMVYYNIYYLIPNYLSKNKIFQYLGLLILAVIVITPLKTIIFFFKFENYPSYQNSLLINLNWYFLFSLLITSSSTVVKIMADWLRQQRNLQELETQTMQSELRFLKSQINPHFLFNTLNSLYALTLKKSDKAPEIVVKLSEMMRYMLYECNEKKVFLSKEIHYIRNYLDLEELRHGKSMQINFEVEGRVGNQKIAPLMFIPFLENSFKHGLNNSITQGYVNIQLNVADESIHFHIENSKADALPSNTHKRSGGIGLVNVKRRLDIIYPDHHDLDIADNPDTYAVDLLIDLD